MKVILTQERLSRALSTVSRITNSRTTLPILSNILVKADENSLTLSSTNLEIAITETVPAKVARRGALTVPARLLTEFISNLPKLNILLEATDGKLSITAGGYKSTINTAGTEEFPEIPAIESKTKLTMPTDLFKKAVSGTALVASGDATRPILTGVYIYNLEDKLYFAATDGYRLAEKQVMSINGEVSTIVPTSTLNEVVRVLSDDIKEITVGFSDDQISFEANSIVITSRLIDGSFINYRQLIPKKTDVVVTVNRGEFIRTIKIAELFARESAGSITVKTNSTKSLLNIHSIASQIGENNTETDAIITGDGTVTLNSKFLLDGLNQFDGENIKIQFSGKVAPILLASEKGDDYKHLIMPVKS